MYDLICIRCFYHNIAVIYDTLKYPYVSIAVQMRLINRNKSRETKKKHSVLRI